MKLESSINRKTVLRRMATLFLIGTAAVAFQGVAWAHYPIVSSATPRCSQGTVVIDFTITSWDTSGNVDGQNPTVYVYFNGGPLPDGVATGAFTAMNGETFSGTANAPMGTDKVHVSAVAAGTWGDGYTGGESSDDWSTSLDVDVSTVEPCGTTTPGTGRFTGGGKVVVSNAIVPASGSVTVTKGFEVDCDMNPSHENLELNWNGSDHFHMDKITSATCTLVGNPPNPPKAPVNKIVATGTGSYDGTPGYTVIFTLWDQGEPGTNDEAGFIVCQSTSPTSCTGTVVLSVPLQLVTTGNIQAHVDQQ